MKISPNMPAPWSFRPLASLPAPEPSVPIPTERVQISGRTEHPEDLMVKLESTVATARSLFESKIKPLQRPLRIDVSSTTEALRTSYSPEHDVTNFPKMKNIRDRGLHSKDIIVHETFHAMVSQAYPEFSTREMLDDKGVVAIHEALADYFAFTLTPDEHFGEDYFKSKPHMRSYNNSRRVSLSPGSHTKANALTAYLIKHKISLSQIREFLDAGDFSLEGLGRVSEDLGKDLNRDAQMKFVTEVLNYETSNLSRYRITPGKELQIRFNPNEALREAHPDLSVEWVNKTGYPSKQFRFEEKEDDHFVVHPTEQATAEKVIAVFKDGDEIIGSRPFYLSSNGLSR